MYKFKGALIPVCRNVSCIDDDFLVSSTDHTELFVYVNNYSSNRVLQLMVIRGLKGHNEVMHLVFNTSAVLYPLCRGCTVHSSRVCRTQPSVRWLGSRQSGGKIQFSESLFRLIVAEDAVCFVVFSI